jgi:hypothetical protein
LETRAYAVKRYLFRLGHAARSGRFACSLEQLVAGLAPVMGWGRVPRGGAERARFARAHRRSVQRWLDDLHAAGVVAHKPERDEHGAWWRTQIELLAAPVPCAEELRLARARARGWRARERRRRGRARRAPSLGAIRARACEPQRRARGRLARERAMAAHEARRRARVDAEIASARARRESSGLLTHPFGAPPTSAQPAETTKPSRKAPTLEPWAQAASRSAQTLAEAPTFVAGTGARACEAAAPAAAAVPACPKERTEEIGSGSLEAFDAIVRRRVAARAAEVWRTTLRREHAARRVREVVGWPVGQACPVGRLRESWVAYRYGLDAGAQGGSVAAGAGSVAAARRTGHAIAVYEAVAAHRPPGWPGSGAAALCALASQHTAAVFAGDVARLLVLAKGMRAAALEHEAARVARALAGARRRRAGAAAPIAFRTGAARWETPEARRRRVRDALLLAGGDPAAWPNAELALCHMAELRAGREREPELTWPDAHGELDGVGARAERYRAELRDGRWRLPPAWPHATQPTTKEAQKP